MKYSDQVMEVGNRLDIQFNSKLVNLDKKLEVVTSNLNTIKVGYRLDIELNSKLVNLDRKLEVEQ